MPNQIGTNTFIRLTVPEMTSQKVEYGVRTGVDGHYVWLTGFRGEEFQIESSRDFASLKEAHDTYHSIYKKLIGTNQLVQWETNRPGGVPQIKLSVNVVVLDVQALRIDQTLAQQGGIVTGFRTNGGIVEARWRMLSLSEANVT